VAASFTIIALPVLILVLGGLLKQKIEGLKMQGADNKEIAKAVSRSTRTIERYIKV